MTKVKYHARDSEADEVEAFGYKFTDGKAIEVKDEDLHRFQQGNPFFEVQGEAQPAPAPAKQENPPGFDPANPAGLVPAADAPKGPFTVKDAGAGWFAILDKDGKQIGSKVRKDDADEFADMSPEDQAEYLK